MNISEIVTKLNQNSGNGFQLSKVKGLINSTWLIYKKDKFYYYFDINQKIEFIDRYKYTKAELEKEFGNSYFTIDGFIN